jgi:hypothetical protein
VPSAANCAGQLLPAGGLREANREDISQSAGIFGLRTLATVSAVALARPLLRAGVLLMWGGLVAVAESLFHEGSSAEPPSPLNALA